MRKINYYVLVDGNNIRNISSIYTDSLSLAILNEEIGFYLLIEDFPLIGID